MRWDYPPLDINPVFIIIIIIIIIITIVSDIVALFRHGWVIQTLYTDIMIEMQNTFEKLVLR